MRDMKHDILVWLPSPMGDAVLCTPALRALREHFKSSRVSFIAEPVVRRILSPSGFNDQWLELQNKNPFAVAKTLKENKFTHAILLKNSFASALAARLAAIPSRIGYARQGRGFLLTDKLYPPKLLNGKFKPLSMIDYYLAIPSRLGADTADRSLELHIDPQLQHDLQDKLPRLADSKGPIIVMVPGGAFGPSKCWPSDRFAQTADFLIENYNATAVISVAPNPLEKQIAGEICSSSKHKLINLAEQPVELGQLKVLFSIADLVITNDTGPRHIAIALQRKVITLFGPNNPAWTDTGYEHEIQIIGNVHCAPCARPTCKKSSHLCMQSITTETVCSAAKELLKGKRSKPIIFTRRQFIETSKSFFIDPDYQAALSKLSLTSIDAVFSFNAAKNLNKKNLAKFRSRLQFQIDSSPLGSATTVFLKRYDNPPFLVQLKNWLSHHSRKSCALLEFEPAAELAVAGINTPKVIAYGENWGTLFEKRSFIISEKIPNAEALERKLPLCFEGPNTANNLNLRRNFIAQLAAFVRKFHQTDYRHRDLYFSHIFHDNTGSFHLIDLARAFKPNILRRRFQVKDIAQVYYSAPGKYFSNTDRMRFYLGYTDQTTLSGKDKVFIRKVIKKANRMARHDIKHGKVVPFADSSDKG